jgi:hypothetical protein
MGRLVYDPFISVWRVESGHGSPAGDSPDTITFFFFFFLYIYILKKKKEKKEMGLDLLI